MEMRQLRSDLIKSHIEIINNKEFRVLITCVYNKDNLMSTRVDQSRYAIVTDC